jgi:hypothetical protein
MERTCLKKQNNNKSIMKRREGVDGSDWCWVGCFLRCGHQWPFGEVTLKLALAEKESAM